MAVYLETLRLVLRQFTPGDVARITDLDSDPQVMFHITGGRATPADEVRDEVLPYWLAFYDRPGGFGFWAAEDRSGEFLGWFHFRPHGDPDPRGVELGYRLRKQVWGHGYATEGSRALIHHGFAELGVPRVYAEAMAVNVASVRVMEKSGLRYVRTFHADWPDKIPGDEHGDVEYALTVREWQESGQQVG